MDIHSVLCWQCVHIILGAHIDYTLCQNLQYCNDNSITEDNAILGAHIVYTLCQNLQYCNDNSITEDNAFMGFPLAFQV